MQTIWHHCQPVNGATIANPSRTSTHVGSDLDGVFGLCVGGDGWHTSQQHSNRKFNAAMLQTAYNCSTFNTALFVDQRGNPMSDVGAHVAFMIECATGVAGLKEKRLKKLVHTAVASLNDDEAMKTCNKIHDHTDPVGRT